MKRALACLLTAAVLGPLTAFIAALAWEVAHGLF